MPLPARLKVWPSGNHTISESGPALHVILPIWQFGRRGWTHVLGSNPCAGSSPCGWGEAGRGAAEDLSYKIFHLWLIWQHIAMTTLSSQHIKSRSHAWGLGLQKVITLRREWDVDKDLMRCKKRLNRCYSNLIYWKYFRYYKFIRYPEFKSNWSWQMVLWP